MNLCSISLIFSLCVRSQFCLDTDFTGNQPMNDESVFLRKIIINYLEKYFSDGQIYISVIVSPNKNQQNHFRHNFLDDFVDDLVLTGFTYNILDKLDHSIRDNWNSFNLIVVDDSTALEYVSHNLVSI